MRLFCLKILFFFAVNWHIARDSAKDRTPKLLTLVRNVWNYVMCYKNLFLWNEFLTNDKRVSKNLCRSLQRQKTFQIELFFNYSNITALFNTVSNFLYWICLHFLWSLLFTHNIEKKSELCGVVIIDPPRKIASQKLFKKWSIVFFGYI